MKRRSKNAIAFVLAALFAFGILCSTFAAPGQALASVSGCPPMNGAMAMADCEHPAYLCGFDSSSNILSQGAVSSFRSNDFPKNVLSVALADTSVDLSKVGASSGGKDSAEAFPAGFPKVSIRLFNSVLNL